MAISTNSPTVSGGAADSFAVTPDLPSGLALDISTGAITGTPTTIQATAIHTVVATNTAGPSTGYTISITVTGLECH